MATTAPPHSAAQEAARVITLPAPSGSPAPAVPVKRFHIPKWAWAIIFAVVAFAGWQVWQSYANGKVTFEMLPLEQGPIQASITATGTLNPVVNVQVGSQVSGNIKALYADFNTKVQQGQLVALIDPQMFQAQVDQASGAAASAAAGVVTAQAQVERAKADLAGAIANRDNLKAALAKDQANALNAQIQWQRSETLFKSGVVSQQDHDTAKAAFDASQAQITADQAQISAAEQSIQAAQAQVNVALTQMNGARAQANQARAALKQAQISLGHTRILAPVSGTVIARHFDVGQTVAASFQAPDIFDIAQDLTQMQVDTNVDESDVGSLRASQAASFTVDAYPGTVFRGKVMDVRKAPIVAQNVVTYDVVIGVSNPDIKLFPGMTANVTIVTSRVDDTLKVPNAALRFRPGADLLKQSGLSAAPPGTQLYLLNNGKLKAAQVKFGISDGRFTAITSPDLKPGDRVVVRASSSAQTSSTPSSAPGRRLPGL
ncbi:MAG: efflux RND transporter periplasmic adaptor subunit [Candidatus Angelobacter sp.]